MVYKGWYTDNKNTIEVAIKTMKGCVKHFYFFVISLYFYIYAKILPHTQLKSLLQSAT